jgi:hypothetical protein
MNCGVVETYKRTNLLHTPPLHPKLIKCTPRRGLLNVGVTHGTAESRGLDLRTDHFTHCLSTGVNSCHCIVLQSAWACSRPRLPSEMMMAWQMSELSITLDPWYGPGLGHNNIRKWKK